MEATAPPIPRPRREAIRNHAAFIWSVADSSSRGLQTNKPQGIGLR